MRFMWTRDNFMKRLLSTLAMITMTLGVYSAFGGAISGDARMFGGRWVNPDAYGRYAISTNKVLKVFSTLGKNPDGTARTNVFYAYESTVVYTNFNRR